MPPVAEYGSPIAQAHPSQRITLEEGNVIFAGGRIRHLELARVTPGYVPAGSALRLQAHEVFSVRWHDGRAFHGWNFRTEAEALARFNSFPLA